MQPHQNPAPVVVVPANEAMAEEPAATIGGIFADKVMMRTFISALAGVIAMTFKVAVDDTTIDNITTIVTFGSFLLAAAFAQFDARKRALAQAAATRESVYAPATVARIVEANDPNPPAIVTDVRNGPEMPARDAQPV
jgi:hypothetical protein